jgi:hypothetical protein
VSFLNQLKSQANALQSQQGRKQLDLEESASQTEIACRLALSYLGDLARHLNVITRLRRASASTAAHPGRP